MEYQEKLLLIVSVLLMVFAIYLAVGGGAPARSAAEAKALLIKGLEFGLDYTGNDVNYLYSYTENSDGYIATYSLAKNGNQSTIEVRNPLSYKKVYFLSNDTVLCIDYQPYDEICSSVQNEQDLENYLESLRVKFLTERIILNNKGDIAYLLDNGFVTLSPEVNEKTVGGHSCSEISYRLDFDNISLADAARFGVGTNTPKIFDFTMCIDNQTGYLYEKGFNYTVEGVGHSYAYTLLSFRPGAAGAIENPENLTADAINTLLREKEQQIQLANCYTNEQGDDRNKCISDIALNLHRRDLCDLAGPRRDRCLVSLVPLTRDESICVTIASQSYRDDCYIELAGAFKNSTYCNLVQNASKTPFCLEVSVPRQQNQTDSGSTAGTSTANQSNSTITDFMNEIDLVETETNGSRG